MSQPTKLPRRRMESPKEGHRPGDVKGMADLSTGNEILRQGLFIFNYFTFFVGWLVIAIGIIAIKEIPQLKTLLGVDSKWIEIISGSVIGIGLILISMGFFGCCGSLRESRRMLLVFSYIVTLLLSIEIVVASLLFVYRDHFKPGGQLYDALVDKWLQFMQTEDNQGLVFLVQTDYSCCGATGALDWQEVYPDANLGRSGNYGINFRSDTPFPPSCCDQDKVRAGDASSIFCVSQLEHMSQQGCIIAFMESMESNGLFIGITLGVIVFLQVLSLVVTKYFRGALADAGKWHGGNKEGTVPQCLTPTAPSATPTSAAKRRRR